MRHESSLNDERIHSIVQSLLVRPLKFSDESSAGYIDRLAWFNGLHPLLLQAHLPRARSRKGRAKAAVPSTCMDQILPAWTMTTLSSLRHGRVCLSCLRFHGYTKEIWRFKGYFLCIEHKEYLVDPKLAGDHRIPVWHLPSDPETLGVQSNAQVVPDPEWKLFRSIWKDVDMPGRHPDARQLALAVFLSEILSVVVAARRGRDNETGITSRSHLVTYFVTQYQLPIPSNAEEVGTMLDSLPAVVHRAAVFRWLSKLVNSEPLHPTVLSVLPLNDWRVRLRPSAGAVSGRGAGGGLPQAARANGTLLIHRLSKDLQVSRTAIHHAIDVCGIAPVQVAGPSRKFRLITSAEALRLREHFEEYLPIIKIPQILGTVGTRLIPRQLRRAQQLRCVQVGNRMAYERRSVDQFLSVLHKASQCSQFADHPSVQLNDPVLYKRVHFRALQEFFEDIKSSKVSLSRSEGNAEGLARYGVPLDSLTRIARRNADFSSRLRRDPRQMELSLAD